MDRPSFAGNRSARGRNRGQKNEKQHHLKGEIIYGCKRRNRRPADREGVQATEGALKLTGACLKNVTALLIAISRQDHKVVGKTSSSVWPATRPLPRSCRSQGGHSQV